MQAHYSTGAVASSFTSTAQIPVTQQEAGMFSKYVLPFSFLYARGYHLSMVYLFLIFIP